MNLKHSISLNSLICMVLVSVFVSGCAPSGLEENGKLNVLFIASDDLRPALGCFGDPLAITPNLDRLSEQGIVFSKAFLYGDRCVRGRD